MKRFNNHFPYDPQALKFIAHWLNTIAMKAPEAPFILVGTHKDELSDGRAALNDAHKTLTDLFKGMVNADVVERIHQPSSGQCFFAVDNKSRENTAAGKVRCKDPAIGEVRAALEHIVMNDKRTTRGLPIGDSKKEGPHNICMSTSFTIICKAHNCMDIYVCMIQVWMARRPCISIFPCQHAP